MADPFADTPDADPASFEVRKYGRNRPVKTCGLVGKTKTKRVDLNPIERRFLEREGYTFARVETHNTFGTVNVDLWGCWDYIAIHPDRLGVLFVQVTTLHNMLARLRKILASPETAIILASRNRAEIHAWSQPSGPGSRWEMQVREVTVATAAPKTSPPAKRRPEELILTP